jgi:GT2 family glycosyltransferase
MLKNGGNPSKARNFGAKKASGNILIFVDSDIVLKPDSIEKIVSKFSRREVISVSGVYTKKTPAVGFFSQLQNLILCYRLSKLPEIVTFTNSAFCAIKRDAFETIHGYNEEMSYFEDVEIGNRLTKNGYKLRIDSSLSVTHLKNFNHWSLICDYFKKAAVSGMYKRKNFFKNKKSDELLWHIKISGISTALVFFSVFLIEISVIPLLVSLAVYSLFLSPLLFFLIKTRGLLFGLMSYFVCFELFLISFVAIICGIMGGCKSS